MTDRLSDQDRAELRRLQQAATPGPWQHRGHWVFPAPGDEGDESGFVAMCGDDARGHDDAAYIVAACNAIPALLDQLEEAEQERDNLQMQVGAAKWRNGHLDDEYTAALKQAQQAEAERDKLATWLAEAENRARDLERDIFNYDQLAAFTNNHTRPARAVRTCDWIELDRLRAALVAVKEAYQGVGDFEGTGERMVAVMSLVDAALAGGVGDE